VEVAEYFSRWLGNTFNVVFGQHSAEVATCCLGVQYVCSRGGFIIGLGGPCCQFQGSLYLLGAVSIVLEDITLT
jgi:hypothetical protein